MFDFFRKINAYHKISRQILGMNSRNLEYIRPFNLSRAKRLADNKLLSKKVLAKKWSAGAPFNYQNNHPRGTG